LGPRLAERLGGSAPAKARLKAVLETIAGRRTISEVCAELGIGEAAFHKLRARALEGALSSLEPAPAGRPPDAKPGQDSHLAELQAELQELRTQLQASRIREEIAITMPHLLGPEEGTPKKKRPKRATKGRRSLPR
jgi:transposase-like protein